MRRYPRHRLRNRRFRVAVTRFEAFARLGLRQQANARTQRQRLFPLLQLRQFRRRGRFSGRADRLVRTSSEEGVENAAKRLDVGRGTVLHGLFEVFGGTKLGQHFDGFGGFDANRSDAIGETVHDGSHQTARLLRLQHLTIRVQPPQKR